MSIDDLREEFLGYGNRSPEWIDKMWHPVPKTTSVDRTQFILEQCKDKIVLNLGCVSGNLHEKIQKVAKETYGIDKEICNHGNCMRFDLDSIEVAGHGVTRTSLPIFSKEESRPIGFDLVVLGEILEHLGNPGYLLKRLKSYECPLLITVPNAFSSAAASALREGVESVNKAHVSWYSYHTLLTLTKRNGYELLAFHWYNGNPLTAEGLIFLVK